MTLIIATTNREGVVITADSRQTYVNRANMPRIASDYATKIIAISDTMVIATAGPAFFTDGDETRSIQSYVEEFRDAERAAPHSCLETANALDLFCHEWLERTGKEGIAKYVAAQAGATDLHIEALAGTKLPYEYIDAAGAKVNYEWQLSIPTFVVAGRDSDKVCHAISIIPFSGVSYHHTSKVPLMLWLGQGEVLNKLLSGTDPFVISTATMTIQDAINFSILLTRTTENLHKFSDGTAASQGGIPGVGGPIDVVYMPTEGDMQWLSRKKLHTEGQDNRSN